MVGDMKFVVALWIILILHKTADAQLKDGFMFKTPICVGKNGALLPMFGRCRGYYVCNDGRAVVGSCDENSRFNPLTLHCDDADNVICPYETSDRDEEIDSDGSESDESEFDSDEIEETTTTARPVLTSKPPKQQKPHTLLSQPNMVDADDLCWGRKSGVALPKADSCTEYYVCKSKKSQLRNCPARQHFSPTRHICMKASEAKCTINQKWLQPEEPLSSPAITAGFCPDEEQDALIPHRDDCGKFMLCSNMMFLVMNCPTGLHFNAQLKRCDYPKIAQCELPNKPNK
ncbi:LOW QUALITY PROTEIN: probable endochitinase, partial [Drosophila grimshawi]|uniref:LOW QUALITY PROTEIN: probable endochitinase n=1 Tax=Drosophila grimshawi TaxID=7222 RepID=UPI001C934E61